MGRFSEIIEKSEFTAPPDTSKNPDQFAADQELAGQTGLPVDYVERNRAEAEKVKKQNVDYSKFADMELGASLTDPAFSNLAQDDLDNLSYLEKTFKGLGTTIGESFKQGAKGVALSAIDEGAKPATSAMMPGVYDPFVSDIFEERNPGLMGDVKQAAAGIAIESIKENEEAIKAATPEGLDVLQKGIRSGVQSLSQMAPGFAASLATRSSAPMLSIAGVQSYGSAYAKARQEGYAPEQAASYGMIDAAVEVATEKLPADKLLKITGEFGNQTLKNVVKFMVTEAGTEQVATFLQSLNAQLFGLDEELAAADTAAEQAKIHAERAAVTLVATVVAGGSQAGIAVGVGKAADKLSGNKQQLQDMVASAEQSNLKRRSPEQFRSFLQSVDPLANIFIPASAFEGVQLDPSNKTLAQVAAQLPQARALNGDIVVPVADVLTDIPADMFAQVAPFVRVEADGVAEIEGRPDMKELIEQVNRESGMAVQSKAFSDDLASQLVATARARPEEAKKYAAVVSARLETLAVDKGMTFDEAKAKYIGELRVVGPEGEIGAGDVLEQPSIEFTKPADAETGKPATVSYGRNTESSKKFKINMDFGQKIEPAGEYMVVQESELPRLEDDKWEYGTITFKNPLVLEHKSTNSTGWKKDLSEMFDGKTGKALAAAVKKAGYDGIITRDEYGYSETVNLSGEKQKSSPNLLAQSVYHGTPHRFDKFSLKAMGTGEGAQAFGNGLYFAGKKEIAEYYRTALSNGVPVVKVNNRIIKGDVLNTIANRLAEKSDTISKEDILSEIDERLSQYTSGGEVYAKWAIKELQDAKKKLEKSKQFVVELSGNKGNLYQADIPEDNELLDWDKPLSEQPAMMEKLKVKQKATYLHNELSPDMTGQQVVDRLARGLTNRGVTGKQQASEYLDSLGIPGLRYLDATARGKEVESHNYVIWDENRITIEAINDELRQAKEFAQKVPQTETAEFKKWFGDSKVVDADGNPLVVYHGTNATNYVPPITKSGSSSAKSELQRMATSYSIEDWTSVPAIIERWVKNPALAERFGVTQQVADHVRELKRKATAVEESPSRNDLAFDIFALPEDGNELGVHLGTKQQANTFGVPFQFYLRLKNPIRLPDLGNWNYQSVMREVRKKGVDISESEYSEVFNARNNNAALRELLLSKGIDGVIYKNEAEGEGDSYIAFRPEQIKSATGNRGAFDPNDPSILNQKERGLISISDKEIVIKLTEASNRSTFLHESGHLFLEIESRIAAQDGISDGQRKMLDWLGVKSFEEIGVEQHEQFARGFEAYAMEGRAPSKDLVEVFRSFARWLKKVYASMRDLDVELNDDIRQFFDRMLAADQAIKEAERLTQYKALFKDAKTAGMTEQEFADYAANQVRAQVKGGEELQSKLLKELTRQTEKWWKEELAAEKEKAAESLGKEKLYQATAFLTGKTKIEGFDVHKMDLEAVKAMLGVEKKKPEKRYRPEAYVDPRLKRENYRGFLDALVNRDLLSVKEGNLALVVDNTQKGESDSGETKYKRTSSVNPEWFQQFNKENTPVSVDQARIIVKKALAGDRLGVNQARFVVAALDEITGKRSDYADTLRRQREFIREERKRIAEDMPVPEDWISYDEIAKSGEVYKPDQYLADADYIDRSLSEIGYSAILNGVDESVVFDIIDTKSTIEAIESIQNLLKEKADEQGYITQASTGERSDQGMAEEEAGKGGKQREKTGLEKFRGMLAKGGLSPDEVAAMFDFASGQDLVDTIANSQTFNEATAAAANQAMIDKHGDILNDGTLQQEAQLAAHNEERGKLILAELRALTRKVGKEAINRDALKFSAKEVIGRTPLKDIHPGKYRTAEVRSAKEAATALAKKDYAAAAQAKLKQAANFYLYREAMDAKQKEQSWRRYLSAVPNRKYSTKDVHPDYIKQMRLLAAVYDFRRSPDPATLSGIGVWIKAQQEAKDVDIAPTVMDVNLSRAMEATAKGEPVQVKNYREMTLDELQGVYDMVKHLRWVGGQLSENEKVKLQAEYEKVAKSIADHGGEIVEVPREPTNRSRALSGLRQFGQDHLALANQIEELDGFEQFGPAFNLVYQGIIDSSNTELKFRRETSEKVNALFKDFGSSDFAEGKGEETITTEDGRKFTLSRRARVMLALYWGSPDSRAAIESGDGLTTNDVNKMLATLTDKELDLVDSIWKLNESFWPDLARVSKAMTGIVPAKVEHVPFAVNGRVMSGGYMRLFYMYDQRDSVQMVDTEGASITRSGSRIVTQTKHGARHERVGSGGRKVDLNVNNVFRALDEVIHDISFAETARATMRAMRNPEVSGAIINHYGKEKYESITSSLEGIIAGNVSNSHPINNFIKHFRTAATYGMLGYSLRNAVQQPVALTNMFGRIGEVETIGAMYDFIVNRNKWGKFVQDRSEFMKNRTSLVNREVAEIMGKISGNVMSSGLKQHAFDLQTIGDSMIAYPGWLAAYRKGLKDFGSEQKAIIYADESVSATIGSGLMKDMSPMLQGSGRLAQTVGPEMLKSITFMGSYFNVIGRLIYSATKQADFKSVRGVASYTRTMTWYLAAPAILSALLVGQGPDDDESWLAWSAKAIASYGFATVFMLRDLVSAASGFTPSSAWSRALDASIRASKGVYDVATGEKEGDKEDIAKILRSASYLYPLPGAGQAARTLEYIGSQEAGNEGDFNIYKAIVVGKDRD